MSQTLICNHCSQTNKLFRFSYNKKYDKYYPHNQCRECSSKLSAEWIQNNKERAREIAREVGKRRYQTPERKAWLSLRRKKMYKPEWDQELTLLVTEEAQDLCTLRYNASEIKWHIDHIIPVNGKIVSGFHIWSNLQVIPAKLNLEKSNAFYEKWSP